MTNPKTNPASAEDCEACNEAEDLCDYHLGIAEGWDGACRRVLVAVQAVMDSDE